VRSADTVNNKRLRGVHFADAHTGWVVGDSGTMLRAAPPIYPRSIEDPKVTSRGLDEHEVSFRTKPKPNAEVTTARMSAPVGAAEWNPLGDATKSVDNNGGSQLSQLTWKPSETIGAHSGDKIEYQAKLDDGGPPFGISLGKCTYDPWFARLWRDNQTAVIGGLSALAFLLIYAGYFAGTLVLAPARLAYAGEAPELDAVAKLSEPAAFFLKLASRVLNRTALP
jgi:hypothetical protein